MVEDIVYDAIIVGGGPGGSTCAAFLAKKGRKVLLLEKEKYPRDKTCGDAISGKAMGVLAELGLIQNVAKADHSMVNGVIFSSPNGKSVKIMLNEKKGGMEGSYVCRRMVYDNILFQNAAKLATVIEGATATSLLRSGEGGTGAVCGVKANVGGKEMMYKSKIVIGADGNGSIAARAAAGHEVDPGHTCIAYRGYYSGIVGMENCLEIHFVKSIMPGYFWIFPLENGLANVGVGMMMSDMKRHNVNLQKAMEEIISKNPLFSQRFAPAKAVSPIKAWALPFGSKKRGGCADGLLLVGDAFGLVDPFSGEGIGNAMLSGKIAAEVADEALTANNVSEEYLKVYENRVWEAVGGELDTSYKMQKLGKVEWLLNFVVSKAANSDRAREAIAGTFASQDAKKGYASPLFYLKLLFS